MVTCRGFVGKRSTVLYSLLNAFAEGQGRFKSSKLTSSHKHPLSTHCVAGVPESPSLTPSRGCNGERFWSRSCDLGSNDYRFIHTKAYGYALFSIVKLGNHSPVRNGQV
jgi:hypothetical protein